MKVLYSMMLPHYDVHLSKIPIELELNKINANINLITSSNALSDSEISCSVDEDFKEVISHRIKSITFWFSWRV